MSMTDEEKTTELLNLMDLLCDINFSNNQTLVVQSIAKLREIYEGNYRHPYAELSSKLQKIIAESKQSEVLDVIGENLNVLADKLEEIFLKTSSNNDFQNVILGYKKFSDHLRLEIGRYNFLKNQFVRQKAGKDLPDTLSPAKIEQYKNEIKSVLRASDRIRRTAIRTQYENEIKPVLEASNEIREIAISAKEKADEANEALAAVNMQIDKFDEKFESNKISSITTLTIFSAVVLAFSGGITFESGIFKGMAESSPYRLAFTIALSGFILFNTICVLLYLVGKMAGKQISTRCRYLAPNDGNCKYCQSCGDGRCTKECAEVSIACRIWHKYSYVFVVNVVLLYVIYSDFFFWLSKGDLLSPVFYLSQGFLALLIVLSIIVHCVHKHKCLERIKLHYKVEILCGIIEKGTSDKASPPKSATGCFLNKICGKELNKKDDVLRYLDEFVDEYLADNCRLSILVTKQEHYVNCRKWFELSEKLNISLIKPLLDK